MKVKHKIIKGMAAVAAAVFFIGANVTSSHAAERQYGGDYSKYQPSLYNNTGKDSFGVSQIGGSVNGYIYDQATYSNHMNQGKARGWHMHTYIWDQTGSNQYQTQAMLNYFLARIQAPYGSIVALDYEAGASWNIEANTDNILLGMRMINQAGFTPMLYSYKPYLMAHVDVNRVLQEFPNSLWVAGYQNGLSVWPNYHYFPSMNGVSLWQYSDYGGQQDMNVDLTGITNNGYTQNKQDAPKPAQPVKQPNPNQKAEVITRNSIWKDNMGDVWHSESGTFTSNTWLHLRWGAKPYSSTIAYVGPGTVIKYDAWSRHDGFVYLRQPRGNGQYGYLVARDASNNQPLGQFK